MKVTESTHDVAHSADDQMAAPNERQSRKQLAGMQLEEQLAAVKPPESDGAVKSDDQASVFEGIEAFEAVMAGNAFLRYGCPDRPAVGALQRALNGMGLPVGEVDGIWGSMTQQGVLRFQVSHGLSVDGVIGPDTMAALNEAASSLGDTPEVVETKGKQPTGNKPGETPPDNKPGDKPGETPPGGEIIPLGKKPTEQKEEPPLPARDKPAEKPKQDKPSDKKNVATGEVAGIFTKLQDPELTPAQLATLHGQLKSALGVPELAMAQDQVQKVAEGQQPGDPRAKTLQFLQVLQAWYQVNRPALQLTPKEAVAIQLRLDHLADFYQRMVSDEYDQPVSGTRAAIVSTALSRIGEVESHTPAGQGKFGKTRYGWEFLDQVFEKSYGGRDGQFDEDTYDYKEGVNNATYNVRRQLSVKYHTMQGKQVDLESWCSHYAMWALKSNGVSAGDWPNVDLTSIATNRPTDSSYKPRPGDIAYSNKNSQHYAIVVRVDGNMIYTIDGNTNGGVNSTSGGKILPVARGRDWFTNFYELNV